MGNTPRSAYAGRGEPVDSLSSVDPLLSWLQSTALGAGGGWALSIGLIIYIVTGFTIRGWTTRKQREEINVPVNLLLAERKATQDKSLETVQTLSETVAAQQGTISEMDTLFAKIPVVRSPPSSGGKVRGRSKAAQPAAEVNP